MKRTAYILVLVLLCLIQSIRAQEELREPITLYNNKIKVKTLELRQRNKELYIRLQVDSRKFKDCEAIRLTPVLVSLSSGRNHILPSMRINGRDEHKAYKRAAVLDGKKGFGYDEPIEVLAGRKIDYREKVNYKPWMEDARLDIRAEVCGCGSEWVDADEGNLQDSLLLQRSIAPYRMEFRFSYLLPGRKDQSPNAFLSNAYLEFPVNRTEILHQFRNNADELGKVNYMIARVAEFTDIIVKDIEISGYASPEGPMENNNQLAKGRAEAMRKYLAGRDEKLSASLYKVTDGGEDWEGLLELIESTPAYAGNTQLREILSISDIKSRKAELEMLDGGRVYQQLLANIYPQLRRVTCRVNYEIVEGNENERIGEIKGKAADVSLDEMFQIALSYPHGSKAFNDVLESAAKTYRKNAVANLNAASAALTRNDLSAAKNYLKRTDRKLPEYNNVAAILEMIRGNYAVAEKMLQRAVESGVPEAEHNLEELHKKLANIKAIKENNRK